MKEYLLQRFYRNNHNKYKKYAEEWVSNLTQDQLAYFVLEKNRTDDKDIIKRNS